MLRIAAICRQKRLAPLLDGCCCCTDVFVQYCHIDIFHCCLVVINGDGLDSSNLEFDPDPQEKVAEVAIRGMQRPRDLRQSQNDSFSFEQVQDGLGAVSSCAILLPHIDLTSDRWIASTQTRSWADYQRYWWHQCWVSIADLPASSTIHFRTSPFPFMSQTNSCHHHAILLSQICFLIIGISWHPEDVIFPILVWF